MPLVRIAGWAGSSSGGNVASADQQGPSVALTSYGQVVTVTAIIGSGNRQGVDMVWGIAPVYGHIGLDLTGANGSVVRIDDITIEDVSAVFHSVKFDWVDVRDYGAIGNGVTDDRAAFDAADTAAVGKRVIVPPGSYFIGSNLTFENPVQFEGTLVMPDQVRLTCTRNYNLDTYAAAFGGELPGFKKALQALFYFTDHVQLDLSGRRVEMTEPIDVAALAGMTTFAQRRQVANGQFSALAGPAWDNVTVTAVGTYSTSQTQQLTAVSNIANIPVGARVSGAGVGREVYVTSKNIGAGTIELSQPLVGGNGTRSLNFTRFQYMFDFGGFVGLSKFEFSNLEFLCNGIASAINLGLSGDTFRVADCTINKPRDKGITSTARGCQDLIIDQCQFISNEQGLMVEDRSSIVFNVNANDAKIRNNRASRFAHFGIAAGSGHIFLGNHFFGGDDEPVGIRRAGLVLTEIYSKVFITGNYIDNSFIELTNEHDDQPDFSAEFSFGGLTVTGNIFTAARVQPWFRWLVITPRGPGHYINGLTVCNNVFRVIGTSCDRIDAVDTTYATLSYSSFRNVIVEGNTFANISQPTSSPVMVQHTQNTAADTWIVNASGYLPF
ncbi:MAG: glycosyl hydrolase family 28-related protein, partial [Paracoccaceae bacterium]